MFGDMCVGSVTAFAGQVSPVSSNANNRWKSTASGAGQATAGKRRDDVPLNYVESAGWMLCDGRTLSTAAYPELFAVLGYLYGGTGEQFCIPDYRGLFLRGTDAGSGMDPDASKRISPTGQGQDSGIGSYQSDSPQTQTYSAVPRATVSQSGNAAGQTSGDLQTEVPPVPARVTTENRPRNIAINYIIKFR